MKAARKIFVGDHVIEKDGDPVIIAEIGVNYYDIAKKKKIPLLDAAKFMISRAKAAGAHAVKFQSYKAENLATKQSPAYWDTDKEKLRNQYELFSQYDKFGEKEYGELSAFSRKNKIVFMSTPFDFESVEYLDQLVDLFKISSSDITNLPFIAHIARKGKPVLLSTGASTNQEIREAVRTIEKEKNGQIVLLHCVLNYPVAYPDANLVRIQYLQKAYPKYLVGYSDHTLPDKHMRVLLAAIIMGACVVEKHFTLDKSIPGNDHYHAMDPDDLLTLNENVRFYRNIRGGTSSFMPSEINSRKFARRSIVAKVDIPKGTAIAPELIAFKRPGTGIAPKEYERVLGKKVHCDILADELLQWSKIEK
ncbi:MAG: N-acetylneuraminate synthase family protein [Candidatus Aminicenantes bacterium]|nr:N-acetylneuraminate synthase family protein [Candidatus Aminicenantes bacterium]